MIQSWSYSLSGNNIIDLKIKTHHNSDDQTKMLSLIPHFMGNLIKVLIGKLSQPYRILDQKNIE
jgi:hypothetical protein